MKEKAKYTIFAILVISGLIILAGAGLYATLTNTDNAWEANGIEPKALDLSCGELESKINSLIKESHITPHLNYQHSNMHTNQASAYLKIYELKHCPAP